VYFETVLLLRGILMVRRIAHDLFLGSKPSLVINKWIGYNSADTSSVTYGYKEIILNTSSYGKCIVEV